MVNIEQSGSRYTGHQRVENTEIVTNSIWQQTGSVPSANQLRSVLVPHVKNDSIAVT
jgi:hypothetical protein